MNPVIVGNLCSLGAMATDSISGTRKSRREILAVQIISQVFYGAGSILLKGYSATMQNVVAILRNLAAMKEMTNKAVEWALISLGVALGMAFNNRGWIGWLPIIANLEYSVAMFRLKDNGKGLKLAFIVNMLMYSAFSLVIRNYVGIASNIFVAVTTAVSMIREARRKSTPASQ